MLSIDERLRLQQEAELFKQDGGNVTLFWAGKMSEAIGLLLRSSPLSISEIAEYLEFYKSCYDEIIFKE